MCPVCVLVVPAVGLPIAAGPDRRTPRRPRRRADGRGGAALPLRTPRDGSSHLREGGGRRRGLPLVSSSRSALERSQDLLLLVVIFLIFFISFLFPEPPLVDARLVCTLFSLLNI